MISTLFTKKKGLKTVENGLKTGCGVFAWFLILPSLLTWLVFWLYVNFDSIVMSFQKPNTGAFTLDNFKYVFSSIFGSSGTGDLYYCVRNTLIYFCTNYFIVQTFNILLAYFFYKKITGYKAFRFLLYLPNLLAGAMLSTIYKELIAFDGPIMDFLLDIGAISKRYQFLATERYAMTFSVVFSLWLSVGSMLLWSLGAMARIPNELYEAAALDGITPMKEFAFITLPMISGTLSTLYVIGISGILNAGGATLFLTAGNYKTQTLSFWIFWQVFTGGSPNLISALGLTMTAFTLPLTLFVKWIAAKISPEVSY